MGLFQLCYVIFVTLITGFKIGKRIDLCTVTEVRLSHREPLLCSKLEVLAGENLSLIGSFCLATNAEAIALHPGFVTLPK